MRRAGRVVVASAAASVLGLLTPAQRSFASVTANTLTVSTADPSGPTDGEVVHVSGRWTNAAGPASETTLYECPESAVPRVGGHVDPARCDPHNVDVHVSTLGDSHGFSDYLVWDAGFYPSAAPNTRVDCDVAHACTVIADATFDGFFADMQRVERSQPECTRVFGAQHQRGRLVKTTDVVGTVVTAGQTITSTFTFPGGDFDRDRDHDHAASATDCVRLGDTIVAVGPAGSWHHDPGPALSLQGPSTFESSYTVPADTPAGTRVCDRGVVSGVPHGERAAVEYSQTLCFTVGAGAVLPEAPWPLALPGSALVVGAAWFLWRRRYRRRPARLRGT
jgi:hypothetical protein